MILTNINILNKFFDSTWKVVLVLLIVIIAFFALFGLIGTLIEKVMYIQGKKVDKFMSPLILSGLVNDEKEFIKISKRKSTLYFVKTSIIPILLILIGLLIFIIYHSIDNEWNESIFNDQTGIGTLFFTWDFSEFSYVPPLGFANIKLQNTPHFLTSIECLNYFIFLFIFTGLVWYLINVQAYISRAIRINKLKNKIFSKDLDNVDLSTLFDLDKLNDNSNNTNLPSNTN